MDKKYLSEVLRGLFRVICVLVLLGIGVLVYNYFAYVNGRSDNYPPETSSPDSSLVSLTKEELEIYNDFVYDENKQPIGFYIGTFEDLNFSEIANDDFEEHADGKISYFIYPSGNLSGITAIDISGPSDRSRPGGVKSSRVLYGNYAEESKNVANHFIQRYYGPRIFHKGAKWISWGTLASDKKYTERQPICERHNVWLTPKADAKAKELLAYLKSMRSLKYVNGRFEKGGGKPITDQELQTAIDYGIIDTEREFLFFTKPVGISKKYKAVQRYLNSKEK